MPISPLSLPVKTVRIAAFGLLAGMALSWPLWNAAARRSFPLLPVWGDATPPGSGLWASLPAFLLAALALGAGVFPKNKWLDAALALGLAALCLPDLNRLQPWVWFYLLVLAVVLAGARGTDHRTANALRWLLAGVYFWGGFSKLTPYFAEDNFNWFLEAFSFTRSWGGHPAGGYALALVETLFAAGLMWPKTRRWFRWLVIGFHTVVVIFLVKLDWNLVVIPWNVSMAGMVWVLFNPTPDPSPTGRGAALPVAFVRMPGVKSPLPVGAGLVVGLLVWLAPFFQLFHLWPYPLSWQLYSNTQPEATFYYQGPVTFQRSNEQVMWQELSFDDGSKLLLDDWAIRDLHVPVFSATRAFRQVSQYLCRNAAHPDSTGLFILSVNRWDKAGERLERIPCGGR